MGFSWESIPITAWELIPFSFVVDWFVNFGDYIQALTPKLGIKGLSSWTTVIKETKVTRSVGEVQFLPGWVVQRQPHGVTEIAFETRIRVPGIPQPGIAFDTDIVHALRNNRGWDLLSLFIQQIKPGKTRFVR